MPAKAWKKVVSTREAYIPTAHRIELLSYVRSEVSEVNHCQYLLQRQGVVISCNVSLTHEVKDGLEDAAWVVALHSRLCHQLDAVTSSLGVGEERGRDGRG